MLSGKKVIHFLAPALLAGVILFAVGACGKNIDNSVKQLVIDQKKIADFLDTYCLTPEGKLIPMEQVEIAATGLQTRDDSGSPVLPEGYIPLTDTAKAISSSSGNVYIIHLKEGAGVTPTLKTKVFIRYTGYYLEGLTEFDNTENDTDPYATWISGIITGLSTGLRAMKTGILNEENGKYEDPGEAWIIIPSTLGFGNEGKLDPVVPPNTCLIYRITLYGIAQQNI